MSLQNSPPLSETDRNRTYFLVRLPLHPTFIKEAEDQKRQATGQVTGQVAVQVLRFCEQPRKAGEIQALVGVKHRQTFRENYLNALIAKGWLERTITDSVQSLYGIASLAPLTLMTRCRFWAKTNSWIPTNRACSQATIMGKFPCIQKTK